MTASTVRFSTFPRTEPPPGFVEDVVGMFRQHEGEIATEIRDKGLKSDDVLAVSDIYRYRSSGKAAASRDYGNTRQVAEAIYGHSRLSLPYSLALVGY